MVEGTSDGEIKSRPAQRRKLNPREGRRERVSAPGREARAGGGHGILSTTDLDAVRVVEISAHHRDK